MTLQLTKGYSTKTNTISNTAVAISAAGWSWGSTDLAQAQRAYITVLDGDVMSTWDGTTPTATLGQLLPADGVFEISGNPNIQALQFIRATGTDAAVNISLEK
jgi:hypothetical protein